MGGLLQSFFNERSFGTLSFIFSATGGRLQHFLARGFLHYPNAILNVASRLLFAVLVLGIDFDTARWPAVALSMLTLALSCTLFGLFLANFCIVFRNWNYFMAIAQTGFLALGGIVIPRTALPIGLEELSAVLPISHALDGLRAAFAGNSFTNVANDLLIELAIGLSYGGIGFLTFKTLESYARRSGAYDEI
jgi:ABC-2 type transport system permease protein